MATLTLQKTNIDLLSLFCSANFDKNRISVADWELSENFLTLFLEDIKQPVTDLSECVLFKLPVSRFAQIITSNELNCYEGTLYSESGRTYDGMVVINEPIKWFKHDATPDELKQAIEVVKNSLLIKP
ncbi:hypothetical protein SNE25_21255 [Mucilaginibacter sabulilitoris]|uniref:Uncharacterized protein n=1 Tax=Mucilaginibacter sabulilitoris TaxID=1173583 RepID=A0ABZ0TJF9_9SPHI|nr:hypothetical protein [Mucilaginibacter sabulilitoris]WPU91849.1 hypothetical protein SNE25_21255 [Mucilaginibacter sabulilitoris]